MKDERLRDEVCNCDACFAIAEDDPIPENWMRLGLSLVLFDKAADKAEPAQQSTMDPLTQNHLCHTGHSILGDAMYWGVASY